MPVKFEESAEEQPGMWSHEASQMRYDAQAYSYEAVDQEMRECKEEDVDEGFASSGYAVEYPQQVLSPHQEQPWNDAVCPHLSPPIHNLKHSHCVPPPTA